LRLLLLFILFGLIFLFANYYYGFGFDFAGGEILFCQIIRFGGLKTLFTLGFWCYVAFIWQSTDFAWTLLFFIFLFEAFIP